MNAASPPEGRPIPALPEGGLAHALLDASGEAVVVYDRRFRFVYVNAAAERLMGAPRDRFIGNTLWEAFPERAAPFREPLTRAMGGRTPVTFELEYPPTHTWTEGRCFPLGPPPGAAVEGEGDAAPALAVFFRDVTDRHEAVRARNAAETARERMRFLAEASAVLSSSLDYQTTLESMARVVVPELCDWCAVHLPGRDGVTIEQVAVAHADPAKVAWARELGRHYPNRMDEPGGVARVLRTGEPLFLPDVPEELLVAAAKDEEHLRIILALGFRSAIAVPLVARGATLGVLLLVTTDESGRRLDADDLAFARQLALRAAVAVDNARLYRAMEAEVVERRQAESRLSLALDAARMGAWEWEVATGRLTWAGHLEEIHGMAPGSFDGTFETFVGVIQEEDRARVLGAISRALEGGGPFHVEYRVTPRNAPGADVRWVAGDGRAEHDETGRPARMVGIGWDVTDLKQAAEAQRLRAEAQRRRAEREALLNRIGEALRALTEPAEILSAAVEGLGRAMELDRCYYAEYDVARHWARVGADWHRDDLPSLAGTYRLSDLDVDVRALFGGPGGLLAAHDLTDPAAPGSAAFSPGAVAALTAMGLRSVLGVALFEGGLPVAALMAATAGSPRAWGPDEVELLRAVAALVHSAMQDARLRTREHAIAERLQEALRPALLGRVPGLELDAHYRPAFDELVVGGDFFDVFAVEKGCYALVVADVSGKGLAAAAQTAAVRHMLRTLLYLRGTTLADAVTALNDMLAENDLLAGFATLFVGAYDVNQRTLTYANAGQEPGLLLRATTGAVEELGPTGPVLGGFPGAAFSERVVPLASGDVLALFTDGLTEAGSSRKDLLGVEGVAAIFRDCCAGVDGDADEGGTGDDAAAAAGRIKTRLMAGVEALATPAGIRDDVCLLVGVVE